MIDKLSPSRGPYMCDIAVPSLRSTTYTFYLMQFMRIGKVHRLDETQDKNKTKKREDHKRKALNRNAYRKNQ
jgi:hypothetical protein